MSLDKSEIQNIALLARLTIDEDDIASHCKELADLIDLIEKMNSVDTASIEPLAHPLDLFSRLRTDNVTEKNERENFQANATETKDGYYLVPKVIE